MRGGYERGEIHERRRYLTFGKKQPAGPRYINNILYVYDTEYTGLGPIRLYRAAAPHYTAQKALCRRYTVRVIYSVAL